MCSRKIDPQKSSKLHSLGNVNHNLSLISITKLWDKK